MKRYKNVFFSRIVISAVFILIQIAWFVAYYFRMLGTSRFLGVILELLAIIFAVFLINSPHELQEYKTGWIFLVLIVPFIGVPFYLFYGDKKQGYRYRSNSDPAKRKYNQYAIQDSGVMDEMEVLNKRAASTSRYIMNEANYPVYKKTEITYYNSGEKLYNSMFYAIKGAKHFIFLEYFTIEDAELWGHILDALVEKAKAGVEIRILYDDLGCATYLPINYDKKLEAMHENIHCHKFNIVVPFISLVMNNRDHRKMLIVDGYKGFTGGINLSDRYVNINSPYGHWKDAGVRLKGEAVWNMTLMYLTMWDTLNPRGRRLYESDALRTRLTENYMPHAYHHGRFKGEGFIQPYGDEPYDDITLSENVYLEVINQAENYVYVFTPYLIMSEELTDAFCIAAKRGVDVRIVTPGIPDKKIVYRLTRSSYARLYSAGVDIYEYTPGFIHAKCMVSDDKKAVVGTVNLDYRSLFLHFENAVYFCNCQAVLDVKKDAEETFKISKKIKPDDVRTSLAGGLFNSVLRVFAPLM